VERHRIGIVVPALNEAATIGSVISSAAKYGVPIVVDDGSTDNTGGLAMAAGADVIFHHANRGYDKAIGSGFERAHELGCAYVVTMDADGQHDPTILGTFIQALDNGADVVVGVRDRRQRVAEHIFSWVGSLKWRIQDPLCGMKAYRIVVYLELGHFDSYGSIGTELTIYAARNGKRIVQVPVATRVRRDESRFGGRYTANKRILSALWRGLRTTVIR